jgi:D-lactate dehydrogenase (cytochrome)
MCFIDNIEKHTDSSADITIGPGTLLKDFSEHVESKGFFYPPDPTEKTSFVSGNISTSASGARGFRYGNTRQYVQALRILLSDGNIIELERGRIFAKKRKLTLVSLSGKKFFLNLPGYDMPRIKNAAGYYIKDDMDAIDLFIGQEGTLGIILKARLRVWRKPPGIVSCYAFFRKPEYVVDFALKAREASANSGSILEAAAIEYFDEHSLNLLRQKHVGIPREAKGAIYFQQDTDGNEDAVVDAWAALIEDCNGLLDETWFAQTGKESQGLADIRHDLPDMVNEYLKKHNMPKVGTDIAIPVESLKHMLAFYESTLKGLGLRYLIFGHIGEAHLHVNILPQDIEQQKKAVEAYDLLVAKAISLGGTPTAEHGIGKTKHRYLEMLYGKTGVREMALLKKQLDSACILGLDNIFPRQLLFFSKK